MPGLPHGDVNRAELARWRRWQLGGQRRRSKPHRVGDRLLRRRDEGAARRARPDLTGVSRQSGPRSRLANAGWTARGSEGDDAVKMLERRSRVLQPRKRGVSAEAALASATDEEQQHRSAVLFFDDCGSGTGADHVPAGASVSSEAGVAARCAETLAIASERKRPAWGHSNARLGVAGRPRRSRSRAGGSECFGAMSAESRTATPPPAPIPGATPAPARRGAQVGRGVDSTSTRACRHPCIGSRPDSYKRATVRYRAKSPTAGMPGDYAVPGGGPQRLDPKLPGSDRSAPAARPAGGHRHRRRSAAARRARGPSQRRGGHAHHAGDALDRQQLLALVRGAQRPGTGRGGERVPVRRDVPAGLSELQPRTLGRGGRSGLSDVASDPLTSPRSPETPQPPPRTPRALSRETQLSG